MLQTASSRTEVVLPDIRPLPSLISGADGRGRAAENNLPPPPPPMSDEEFFVAWESQQLPSWGHEAQLRYESPLQHSVRVGGRGHGGFGRDCG